MMNGSHRIINGARLLFLRSSSRCLASVEPALAVSPSPVQGNHKNPVLKGSNNSLLQSFSTSSTKNFSKSPIQCYDREILSDTIRTSSKALTSKTYFIDLKEDDKGRRYIKITEKSNGKKSGKYEFVGFALSSPVIPILCYCFYKVKILLFKFTFAKSFCFTLYSIWYHATHMENL